MNAATIRALHELRAAEKDQSLFYRSLAAQAEAAGDVEEAERLTALYADEQHHLARVSEHLLTLGESLADLRARSASTASLEHWEAVAGERERAEITRCRMLLEHALDDATTEMLHAILRTEQIHLRIVGPAMEQGRKEQP